MVRMFPMSVVWCWQVEIAESSCLFAAVRKEEVNQNSKVAYYTY